MDNNNLSKIPVSELTPENIDSLRDESGISVPIKKKQSRHGNGSTAKRLILLIVGIILFIGVVVAIYFIFKPSGENNPENDDAESPNIVWAPSDDEDPGQEYVNQQQATIDNPEATTDEKLNAQLSITNLYAVTGQYEEAEVILNSISRDGLTHRQLFSLYSAYAYLYERSGETSKNEEYNALVEEILSQPWGEAEE